MEIWHNVSTCGAYMLYVFTVLWMLTKEFFGYVVDWSRRPPSTPGQREGAQIKEKQARKLQALRALLDKDENLEANITPPDATVACAALGTSNASVKDVEENSSDSEATAVSADDEVDAKDVGPPDLCKDHILPLYYTKSQLALTPVSQPQAQAQEIHASTQPQPRSSEQVSLTTTDFDISFTSSHLNDVLQEHHESGDATAQRRIFVKGLQYIENNDFHFPRLTSAVPPPVDTLYAPTTPTSPCTPPNRLSSTTSSGSCASAYTTVTETSFTDLPTAADEDIPIHLIKVPSWRCDPDRAKCVFGSLARGASTVNIISSSASGAVHVVKDAAESRALVVGESKSEADFESMIIRMGFAPPSAIPGVLEAEIKMNNADSGGAGRSLKAMENRKSVISDVLSWVESST